MYGVLICVCFALSLPSTRAIIPSPTGLRVQKVNSTTAVIRWDPIPKEHVRGVLLGYRIQLVETHTHNWNPRYVTTKNTSAELSNLTDWPEYQLGVLGYTIDETGSYAYYRFKTPTIPSPNNLQLTRTNVTSFEARWDPIPKEHARADILGYKIQLRYRYNISQSLQVNKVNGCRILLSQLPLGKIMILFVQGFTRSKTGQAAYRILYTYAKPLVTGLKVVVNGTTAVATWDPIPEKFAFGKLLVFIVSLYSPSNRYVYHNKTKDNEVVLTNLQPASLYYLLVTANTTNATGLLTSHPFLSGCGGVIKDQLNGYIQVNDRRDNSWYTCTTSCSWVIKGKTLNSLIVINVNKIVIRELNCRGNYLNISSSHGQPITTVCHTRPALSLVSFGSVKIELFVRRWYTGFYEIKLSYFILPNGLDEVPVKDWWNISANSTSSTSITLHWDPYPAQGKSLCNLIW